MRLTAISGSLRARSSGGAVLRSCLDHWEGEGTHAVAGIGALPLFNPDDDGEAAEPHPEVAALRAAVAEADALLLVSPEYAAGPPGALKNALDWLVSSGECVGLPVAVVTASPFPAGGDRAAAQLRATLAMMSADVVAAACREIGGVSAKTDPGAARVTDPATLTDLGTAVRALAVAARADGRANGPLEARPARP